MDYKEVRKRKRIKRKGGTIAGREIEQPKRVDYKLRREITTLIILILISVVLGVILLADAM